MCLSFVNEWGKNKDVEKIRLTWLEITIIAIIAIGFIMVFIPVNPTEDGVVSLFSFLISEANSGKSARFLPFVLYIALTIGSIALLVFNQRSFFKAVLFAAGTCMFLLCYVDSPARLFSSIIASVYVGISVILTLVEFIIYCVKARKMKQEMKKKDQQ